MRVKLKQVVNSEVFDSIKVGFKYVAGVLVSLFSLSLFATIFPKLFLWLFIVFAVTTFISLFSYMVGDVMKDSVKFKDKEVANKGNRRRD
jgi:membrane-anchored protein YejM (alkaline phosphatase superfamily)